MTPAGHLKNFIVTFSIFVVYVALFTALLGDQSADGLGTFVSAIAATIVTVFLYAKHA